MADFLFDFCPNSRVAEKIAPDEPEVQDFNGWVYNPVPVLPFRPSFRVELEGLRWYLDGSGGLDAVIDPEHNAGRLEAFYMAHRLYKPFNFHHEYLGTLEMRFLEPVSVPKGLENGGGVIDVLELNMIQHTSSYT